jgi:hypothetical protein
VVSSTEQQLPPFDPAKTWNLREVAWDFEGEQIIGAWLPRGMDERWDEAALDKIRADLLPECAATVRILTT